jgi:sec-independent protein translocase protein TatA
MSFGVTEMLIVLAIVLIVFGAGKLPGVMGDLAKGVRNFKAGLKDEPDAVQDSSSVAATGETPRIPPAGRPTTPPA